MRAMNIIYRGVDMARNIPIYYYDDEMEVICLIRFRCAMVIMVHVRRNLLYQTP